jgi:hypothetical protein
VLTHRASRADTSGWGDRKLAGRTRTWFVTFPMVLALVAVVDGSATTFHQTTPPVAAIDLPLELLASRPLVRLKINGQGPFAFLIDPEAQGTVIDAHLLEILKLAPQRNADGGSELHVNLELGSNKLVNVVVNEGDAGRLVPELGPTSRPRGVLSPATWAGQLVTIDYTRWRVRIEAGALPEPDGTGIFALRAGTRELLVPLSVGEHRLWCHVDPLFPGGLLLPASSLKEFKLADESRESGSLNARTGPIDVRQARLAADAIFGPFEFRTPLVLFGGPGEVATLGAQWLTDFSITYDVAHARARLDRRTTDVK